MRPARTYFSILILLWAMCCHVGNAYAKTIRIDLPDRPMTVREARKAMTASLSDLISVTTIEKVRFTRSGLDFFAVNDYGPRSADTGKSVHRHLDFQVCESLTLVSIGSLWDVRARRKSIMLGKTTTPMFTTQEAARTFAESALVLRAAVQAPDPEESDFHTFSAMAESWRKNPSLPAMPDEARAYQLLAEDAFKRKDFEAALEAYSEALDRFPLWPEGQYNAALLAAETGDYELAVHHMRRYLALAPDAPDAASAKDKLLLWQLKAKE